MIKLAVSSIFAGSCAHVIGTFFFILPIKKSLNSLTNEVRDAVNEARDERWATSRQLVSYTSNLEKVHHQTTIKNKLNWSDWQTKEVKL